MKNITRRRLVKAALATTALILIPTTVIAKLEPAYYMHKEFSPSTIELPKGANTFAMSWCKKNEIVSTDYVCDYKRLVEGKVCHRLEVQNGVSKYYIEGVEVVLKKSDQVKIEVT